ncbi:MAG: FecR family protein, partial [Syntrophobacteraceae bacterium]
MLRNLRILARNRSRKIFCRVLLILLVVAWADASAAAADSVGKVESLSGSVFIERGGQRTAAKAGDPVYLKDKLQTSADSSAEIVFLDESRMKMSANTVLEITEYLFNPSEKSRNGLVSLMSGKARFAVQELQDFKDKRFRVHSQTAVVGSRDTDFIVWIRPEAERNSVCDQQLLEAM